LVEQQLEADTSSWRKPLEVAVGKHVERLAHAEHLGWCAERRANGWTFARERNNALKHHPLLVESSKVSQTDKEKDRSSARSIPDPLEIAMFKAAPVKVNP
jgi:hypothetical protein